MDACHAPLSSHVYNMYVQLYMSCEAKVPNYTVNLAKPDKVGTVQNVRFSEDFIFGVYSIILGSIKQLDTDFQVTKGHIKFQVPV